MFKRVFTFIVLAYLPTITILFIGCAEEESYTPEISGIVPSLHHSGQSQVCYKPNTTAVKPTYQKSYKPDPSVPYGWMPSTKYENNWQAIVIHHSATDCGNVASIDNYHRNTNGWDGIGYDFVIGNGNGCYNGSVESTFRWKGQKTGAHCKTDPSNWANRKAIGICLIGNFDESRPSYNQMTSLVKLVNFLSKRYNIPVSQIYGHNTTPRHSTNTSCPGSNFSMYSLKAKL